MTDTPPAPTLTAHTDADPCPRVEIVVSPMPADADTLTVWRSYNGGTEPVRDAFGVTVAGDTVVTDYEPPFGTDVVYTCQTADADGTPSAVSPAASVQLDVPDVWAQDPLDPQTSMAWPLKRTSSTYLRAGSFTEYQLPIDAQLTSVLGSPLPIGASNIRQAPAGIPIVITSSDPAAWQQIQALLKQATVICLRLPSTVPLLDPVMYVQPALGGISVDPNLKRITWTLSVTQQRGPSLRVILAVRALDDLAAEADTLDGLGVLYGSLLDLERGA